MWCDVNALNWYRFCKLFVSLCSWFYCRFPVWVDAFFDSPSFAARLTNESNRAMDKTQNIFLLFNLQINNILYTHSTCFHSRHTYSANVHIFCVKVNHIFILIFTPTTIFHSPCTRTHARTHRAAYEKFITVLCVKMDDRWDWKGLTNKLKCFTKKWQPNPLLLIVKWKNNPFSLVPFARARVLSFASVKFLFTAHMGEKSRFHLLPEAHRHFGFKKCENQRNSKKYYSA